MTKEEKKNEMKNRISMALKDPILQQCFEVFCKNLTELESKIADIKANCDLAIEGRDIKIKELEKQVKDLEWQLQEVVKDNDYYQAENKRLEQQLEKIKKYGKLLQDICTVMGNEVYMVVVGLENRVKVLWDSSEEKDGLKMVEDIEKRLLKIKPQDWAEIDKWEIKEND